MGKRTVLAISWLFLARPIRCVFAGREELVVHALCCLGSLAIVAAVTPGGMDDRSPIFTFCSWTITILAVVTLIWPLNIPLAALAYKVRRGYEPIDLEPEAFWWRSTFAALGLCGISLVMLGLAYLLIQKADFPAGAVHLLLLLVYLPFGVWFVFWIYAMEDLLDGLSVFVIYVLLPGLPILALGWLMGFWSKLAHSAPWLLFPS